MDKFFIFLLGIMVGFFGGITGLITFIVITSWPSDKPLTKEEWNLGKKPRF